MSGSGQFVNQYARSQGAPFQQAQQPSQSQFGQFFGGPSSYPQPGQPAQPTTQPTFGKTPTPFVTPPPTDGFQQQGNFMPQPPGPFVDPGPGGFQPQDNFMPQPGQPLVQPTPTGLTNTRGFGGGGYQNGGK